MKLHFAETHNSVESFEDIVISDFSIFTGKNGSGKTHILEAIKEGKITVDDFPKNQILYLNYLTFEHDFQTRTDRSQSNQAWSRLIGGGNDLVFQLKNNEGSINSFKPEIENIAESKNKRIFALAEEDFASENSAEIIKAISDYKQTIENLLDQDNYLGDEVAQSVYDSVISRSRIFLSNIKESEFSSLYQKTAIGNRKILSDLSNVFLGYFRNKERNTLKKANNKIFLSDEEFIKEHGIPPWELIRNIFTGFGLSFDINDPMEDNVEPFDGSFQISFKHTEKANKLIPFNALSSGEKILITLVNAIYTSKQKTVRPKLILLDEIDGPLNPSIIKKFISYLEDNFLSRGIKIILATHSPSTVAFSPEDSVYIVNTNDRQPIKKVNNREGIRILSEGFVTLSDILEFEKIKESNIVISEGKNFNYLNRAKDIFAKENTDLVILNRDMGGTAQLRTLLNFMRIFNSTKCFVFVFDCDYRLKEKRDEHQGIIKNENGETEYENRNFDDLTKDTNNNNRMFVFSKNNTSDSDRGIENLFNRSVTTEFSGEFDRKTPKNKNQFEKYILERNDNSDFENFAGLFDFVKNKNLHNL